MIEFTDRDIKRGTVVEPAWYRVKIDSLEKAVSAKGDSTNYKYEGTIISNADNGSDAFAGVPTPYWNFNSKAIGFMADFFKALGQEVKAGSRFDENNAVGKELDVFIENAPFEGRTVNRINHKYRLPRESGVTT